MISTKCLMKKGARQGAEDLEKTDGLVVNLLLLIACRN
uniref:Uncharacterized protein n=1 Tax=Arundo donax TaxID=35708 RepID=A0A0A8YZN0_ARUDO